MRGLFHLFNLPGRGLCGWVSDQFFGCGRFSVRAHNGHEGRSGNFHDRHALYARCPAYINGRAVYVLSTHPDLAARYSERDDCLASPRRLALIFSKRSGDNSNSGRETNRDTSDHSRSSCLHWPALRQLKKWLST